MPTSADVYAAVLDVELPFVMFPRASSVSITAGTWRLPWVQVRPLGGRSGFVSLSGGWRAGISYNF